MQAAYPLKGMNNASDIPPLLDWYMTNIGLFQVRNRHQCMMPAHVLGMLCALVGYGVAWAPDRP
jgi:hypothetical protein